MEQTNNDNRLSCWHNLLLSYTKNIKALYFNPNHIFDKKVIETLKVTTLIKTMSNINWKRKKKRIHIRPQYKLKSFYGYTIHICTGKQWSHTSIISGPYFSKNCRFSLCLAPFSLCPSASNHSLFRKDCAATAENFQNLKLLPLKKIKCKPGSTVYFFLLLTFWR